ncbi:lysine-rich nucleolar protein 1 [Amblyraja radiata]|uniref:lysine-rich nucleolar protein 1 n=1 Tax=Amblyraja radiata TaxID=386614 RepID=UPI0014028EFE|nr:lysine-rich nucleolar protein 1 [Amblyraja radiata]
MFKIDIEATPSKSGKNEKHIEISASYRQKTELSKKHKSEGKKRKKHKVKTILNEPNESELSSHPEVCGDLQTVKKKKRKSKSSSTSEEDQRSKIEEQVTKEENPPQSETGESVCGGLKKKKKRKCKREDDCSSQTISEENTRTTHEDEATSVVTETKCNVKRMRKAGVKQVVVEEDQADSTETSDGAAVTMIDVSCVAEVKSAKKKKKRSHTENMETHEGEKSPKKGKKSKTSGDIHSGNDRFTQTCAWKLKEEIVESQISETDRKYTKKRKREKLHSKKQRSGREEKQREPLAAEKESKGLSQRELATECITKTKKKKRKRSASAEGEETEKLDTERIEVDTMSNVCKFQNSPSKVTVNKEKQATPLHVPEESVKKKKKKKEKEKKRKRKEPSSETPVFQVKTEQCDSDDLQFVSEKKGNVFEVTIDKARRQALQEEVDRESRKTDTPEARACSHIRPMSTGTQWDSATFGSVDQKNKFLRLMGGLKSSNQPQSSGHASGKPNMALNKQEEHKFNNILQKEFDKALNLRQNRGIGLGFQSPSARAATGGFFIDKQASKSMKFDND